jgi:hypothetical protein
MADSWQKYIYENHQAFAVGPFTSESSFQLLDVLVKRNDSKPILYNVGSMVDLGVVGPNESRTTVDLLRRVLRDLESNQGKDSCDFVGGCCKSHRLFFTQVGYQQLPLKKPKLYIVPTIFCCLA